MFSRFFETLGAKNTVNTDVFCASEAQDHGIYVVFFASGRKKHGIYSVFWTAPSKNTGICAVFGMLQELIAPCKSHKTHVNYSVLGLIFGFVTWWRGGGWGGI